MKIFLCLLLLFVISAPVTAQTSSGNEGSAGRQLTDTGVPFTRALRVNQDPVVDGDVLNDPAYDTAMVATDFVQSRPFEGEPASERTEVHIVYSEDTLYFGIVCYTEDPTTIIVGSSDISEK